MDNEIITLFDKILTAYSPDIEIVVIKAKLNQNFLLYSEKLNMGKKQSLLNVDLDNTHFPVFISIAEQKIDKILTKFVEKCGFSL